MLTLTHTIVKGKVNSAKETIDYNKWYENSNSRKH